MDQLSFFLVHIPTDGSLSISNPILISVFSRHCIDTAPAKPIVADTGLPHQATSSKASAAKQTNGPSEFYVPTKTGTLITAPNVPAQELANTASVATSITASSASTSPSGDLTKSNGLTPNGIKAGVAGYVSITENSSWSQFRPHIGWYSDYWPNTIDSGSVKGIPMVSPAFMCYTVEKLISSYT